MKKKSLYSFFVVITLSVFSMIITSCKKYLTELPNASFSSSAAFSSVTDATDAVLGVYAVLSGDQGYGIRLSMYYTVDADDFFGPPNSSAPDNDRRDIARYIATSQNAQLQAPFVNLFTGIERANICIKNIPLMAQYTGGSATDQASLKKLYGEALTLRAQFYFELIRNWGDVPAQFIPAIDEPTLFLARTNRDVIYTQILADLLTAESVVPWRSAANTTNERITLGAVKGLRARIALFMGGYSLRNDTQVMSRRSDYLTYYQIALSECNDIINSGQHALEPSYVNLFKSYVDAHTADPTNEIIFEVGMGGGTGTADSKLGYYDGPKVNSLGNGSLIANPAYFYAFDPVNDTRRDVTIATYYTNLDGTKVLQKLTSACSGKFRRDWISNPTIAPTSLIQYFGIDWPILRYSDVLLMYAEADNEINQGPKSTDISYLNQVRTRAYGSSTTIGTAPTTYAAFFTAIQNERLLEFGGEGIRKYDLIRWNLFNPTITAARTAITNMMNKAAPYATLPQSMYYLTGSQTLVYGNSLTATTPSTTPTGYTKVAWVSAITNTGTAPFISEIASGFTVNHSELLPIPLASLQANPLLTQNPGY